MCDQSIENYNPTFHPVPIGQYHIIGNSIHIQVGEPDLLRLDLAGMACIEVLKSTDNSIVVVLTPEVGSREIMKVRWSSVVPFPEDRSAAICSALNESIPVPTHLDKRVMWLGRTAVCVTFRSYIEGSTARDIWQFASQEYRESILQQLQGLMGKIHTHSVEKYGFVAGTPFCVEKSDDYVSRLLCRSRIQNHLDATVEIDVRGTSNCRPTLCHYNLNPDHIIISDGKINGVIGWSGADYAPVVMEYLWYSFKTSVNEDREWFTRLSTSIKHHDEGTSFYRSVLDILYRIAWSNWGYNYRADINNTYRILKSSASMENKAPGDLSSHIAPKVQTHSDLLKSQPPYRPESTLSGGTWSELSRTTSLTNPFADEEDVNHVG